MFSRKDSEKNSLSLFTYIFVVAPFLHLFLLFYILHFHSPWGYAPIIDSEDGEEKS